ncbi:hypothetical protein Q7P37_000323 [Cladosporium fusiforme]
MAPRKHMFNLLFLFLVSTSLAIQSRDNSEELNEFDDSNEFPFTKGAAIGDSYAAGLGAGTQIGEQKCSWYDASYANLVGLSFGNIDFTYSACSGALIKGATKQAKALSSNQDFIIISAGGNDAKLREILNGCVYRFLGEFAGDWRPFDVPDCDEILEEVDSALDNGDFDETRDELIDVARGKLAEDGNIYYVGYAKFWDETDEACDEVSWHLWGVLGVEQRLTQKRRRDMNEVVDSMNDVLRSAVGRAGPQVHFIEYDKYVGMTNGRYCQQGVDEAKGDGANRPDLFFYQIHTREGAPEGPDNIENAKRDEDTDTPANNTLGAIYGSWIEATIEAADAKVELNADNANEELVEVVKDKQEAVINSVSSAKFQVGSSNDTSNATAFAPAVAPSMKVKAEDVKKKESIPDSVARVFHPTRGGHEIIANLILYKMEAVRAGDSAFPEIADSAGGYLPHVGNPSCNGDSTATWAHRDSILSSIHDFCSDPRHLHASKGDLTSATFNSGSLNYLNISISWATDGEIDEHACRYWLDAVTEGCDIPDDKERNSENNKHGGTIEYESSTTNAILQIQPLAVRKVRNSGRTDKCTVTDKWDGKIQQLALRRRELSGLCSESLKHQQDDQEDSESGIAGPGDEFNTKMAVPPLDGAMNFQIKWPRGERAYEIFNEECLYFFSKLL